MTDREFSFEFIYYINYRYVCIFHEIFSETSVYKILFKAYLYINNRFLLSDLYLNYQIFTGGSPKRRDELLFDDISLNDIPAIRFSCKYERTIRVDSDLLYQRQDNPDTIDSEITKTGILEYSATVHDTSIGHDHFTTVVISPKHHLSNVYVT